jgi:hypothetical protein
MQALLSLPPGAAKVEAMPTETGPPLPEIDEAPVSIAVTVWFPLELNVSEKVWTPLSAAVKV